MQSGREIVSGNMHIKYQWKQITGWCDHCDFHSTAVFPWHGETWPQGVVEVGREARFHMQATGHTIRFVEVYSSSISVAFFDTDPIHVELPGLPDGVLRRAIKRLTGRKP